LLLAFLVPGMNASALTNAECKEIYDDAMSILTSGTWLCKESDPSKRDTFNLDVLSDGTIIFSKLGVWSSEYFLSVGYDGLVYMIRKDKPFDPSAYYVSFSFDSNNRYLILKYSGLDIEYVFTKSE
jgi:dipeptidyl aminopeptidase/acylaminoacyl peptidase